MEAATTRPVPEHGTHQMECRLSSELGHKYPSCEEQDIGCWQGSRSQHNLQHNVPHLSWKHAELHERNLRINLIGLECCGSQTAQRRSKSLAQLRKLFSKPGDTCYENRLSFVSCTFPNSVLIIRRTE
ncbi:unnamed protein product [Enterobius vermicularis]|uniref:Uncharacterized protein n=1 Tax=Enterobius vermicularis TaxID=51028 RepID=A0A0N4VDG0_ENTVE|nr:unnamed protein product [Enterobius vermicularis]